MNQKREAMQDTLDALDALDALCMLQAENERLTADLAEEGRLHGLDMGLILCLTAERDALKQDAKRMDWLEAHKRPAPEPEIIGWATHHEPPMLFPTKVEAAEYCDDDEKPIALVAKDSE